MPIMLILHSGSELVTDTTLLELPPPTQLGPYHQPVPHGALVRGLKVAALAHGYTVMRQQIALNRSGHRLFGVMDLQAPPSVERPEDRGLSIGFRNSTDETLGIRIVAGVRVFVCDNLALSGDLIALKRRNTSGLDLDEALHEGFARYLIYAGSLERQIVEMQAAPLSNLAAKALIVDLFSTKVLPLRLFKFVTRYYFNPDEGMSDCQPCTRWALLNACTRAVKRLPPARAFAAHIGLGQAFGLSHN
jgi:hypothetical protein